MDENINAPYRATRLWNEVVLAFRTGMPLKRHRHHMLLFENCFTASEAVTWLNCYLKNNSNFGPEVTREQTIQLLKKFLKCHVIEDVRGMRNEQKFQDNAHLYRFAYYSPIKSSKKSPLQVLLHAPLSVRNGNNLPSAKKKSTLVPRPLNSPDGRGNIPFKERSDDDEYVTKKIKNKGLPECCVVARSLSVKEVENVWKTILLTRLQTLLNTSKLDHLINMEEVSGRIIMHNMNRISKNGVVILLDKTDDLPHWVMSAMKCLANWPYASGSGSCLPNYPGFEIDVFRVVQDYFTNLDIPLIPSGLYQILKEVECTEVRYEGRKIHPACHTVLSKASLPSFGSMEKWTNHLTSQNEDAILEDQKTSTPLFHYPGLYVKNTSLPFNGKNMKIFPEQLNAGKFILDDPDMMWDFPLSMCYETAFTNSSPVTRIVPHHPALCKHSSQSSLHTLSSQATELADTASTISACSYRDPNACTKQSSYSGTQLSRSSSPCSPKLHQSKIQNQRNSFLDLNFASRSASLTSLNQSTPNVSSSTPSSVYAISTLPRKDKSYNELYSENKGFCSMRSMKRDHEQRREENIKNAQKINRTKSLVGYYKQIGPTNYCNDGKSSQNSMVDKCFSQTLNNDSNKTSKSFSFDNFNVNEEICIPPATSRHSSFNEYAKHFQSHETDINENPENSNSHHHTNYLAVDQDPHEREFKVPAKNIHPSRMSEKMSMKIIQILQLFLLLLPPCNRRHLHLLLRMMTKIIRNDKLSLSQSRPNRDYLLSFLHSILCGKSSVDYDKHSTFQIVSLILAECETILQPPDEFRKEVENRLFEMQKAKIRYTLDDSCTITYCEQVSMQQFQEQQVHLSQQALAELLENIIQDVHILQKEKRKKLKQFKENHPDIYAVRFPTPAVEAEVLGKQQPKPTFLRRLLHMRT